MPNTYQEILKYVHPDDYPILTQAFQNTLRDKATKTFECRIVSCDHATRHVFVQLEVFLDEDGQPARVIGFIQDITGRKDFEHRLYEKEKQLSQIYNNPDVGIWSVNVKADQLLFCSQGIEQISGYSMKELQRETIWSSIIHPEDLSRYFADQQKLAKGNILRHQYRIIHKNGKTIWVQDYTIPTLDERGTLIQLDGLISDISEQKVLNEKVQHLSYHDYLTNLPNRRMFDEKLQQHTEAYRNKNMKFAVMIFDIDRFKFINDTLGHSIGDEVLIELSKRLLSIITSDDLLARIGGDEFGLLIANMNSIDDLEKLAESIIQCLKDPFVLNGYELFVTASIGISIYPDDGEHGQELLKNADIALFKAEEQGRNNYKIISPSSSIESYKLFSLGRDLLKALENNEMVVYYQPRVDTRSGKMMCAEALIRWDHPEWGLVSPNEFLMIAEENNLMIQIEDWVLTEVCQQLKKWKDALMWTVPISINISATHFMKQKWLDHVEQTIRKAGIHPTDIEFEITESSFLNNEEVVKNTIKTLKEMGIKISLDDFGKGYSSLSYLAQFPFDVIKIDKSFIQNMNDSQHDLFIVKSIIYLAKGLEMDVVAEGVETIEQYRFLKKEHCQQIQGYLFSRPVSVLAFESLLQKKVLQPMDPKLKVKQSKRKYYRVNFPYPLAAKMKLMSIAGKTVHLGKSSVLIEDMSIGGLRFLSTLKLPIREDIILQFEMEILDKDIQLIGNIVWKEEEHDDITEYGIKFIIQEKEQSRIGTILNSFDVLMKNSTNLPSYRMVKEDKLQYLQSK